MLPDVNDMMWREAKNVAINVEANRVCAQIRISAFIRKILHQTKYLRVKQASIVISKHVRRFLARVLVAELLEAVKEDETYQMQSKSPTVVQASWRRCFWRKRFVCYQERRIEEER